MSVSISGIEFVKPCQVLYSNPAAIDALAREIVSNMAEASIDMICDGGPSEYPSKTSIENCLQGLPEMGVDFVRDAIRELEEKLIARLQTMQIKSTVKAIHFEAEGYKDVEVDVECI